MGNILLLIKFTAIMLFLPGPNNIMLMSTGVNFGFRKGLSHSMGVTIGFSVMALLVGLGFGFIFEKFPFLQTIIRIGGLAYMLYLAWLIAGRPLLPKSLSKKAEEGIIEISQDPEQKHLKTEQVEKSGNKNRITFWKALLFQWINPKAWITISIAIATYSSSRSETPLTIPVILIVFFSIALLSSHVWLIFGSVLYRFLNVPRRKVLFNYIIAGGVLFVVIIPIVYEMLTHRI